MPLEMVPGLAARISCRNSGIHVYISAVEGLANPRPLGFAMPRVSALSLDLSEIFGIKYDGSGGICGRVQEVLHGFC